MRPLDITDGIGPEKICYCHCTTCRRDCWPCACQCPPESVAEQRNTAQMNVWLGLKTQGLNESGELTMMQP